LIKSHEKLPKTKKSGERERKNWQQKRVRKITKVVGTYLVTGRVGALLKRRFGRLFGRFSLKMFVFNQKQIRSSFTVGQANG
jgi:hypothetical protein